jgi:hypothetical protein
MLTNIISKLQHHNYIINLHLYVVLKAESVKITKIDPIIMILSTTTPVAKLEQKPDFHIDYEIEDIRPILKTLEDTNLTDAQNSNVRNLDKNSEPLSSNDALSEKNEEKKSQNLEEVEKTMARPLEVIESNGTDKQLIQQDDRAQISNVNAQQDTQNSPPIFANATSDVSVSKVANTTTIMPRS